MWDDLKEIKKIEYKKMILAFSSLTEVFAQKASEDDIKNNLLVPVINSKYQETVFQRIFTAHPEDIKNTPFDVSLTVEDKYGNMRKFLVGIKTFSYKSSMQKVAQLKSFHDILNEFIIRVTDNARLTNGSPSEINKINKKLYLALAKKIGEIRNEKIDSSISQIKGFDVENNDSYTSVYHVLMPTNKKGNSQIFVGEISYDKIDIENIKIKGCSDPTVPSNFIFSDGKHTYKFTSSDSQLWMDFEKNKIIKDKWKVTYVEDAYSIFSNIATQLELAEKSNESYSWLLYDKKEIPSYSGFNSFYALGSKLNKKSRISALKQLKQKMESIHPSNYDFLYEDINKYFSLSCSKNNQKKEKENLRKIIIEKTKLIGNDDLEKYIYKLLFRPKSEVYIPIPNARKFHINHPDFFGMEAGCFESKTSHKLSKKKEERTFTLVFEPSGQKMKAFITQDNGKAIESVERQSDMGEWLINNVFQLKDYEKLTRSKLEELNINGIRLEKDSKTKEVHFSFIWIDKNNKPKDFIK